MRLQYNLFLKSSANIGYVTEPGTLNIFFLKL